MSSVPAFAVLLSLPILVGAQTRSGSDPVFDAASLKPSPRAARGSVTIPPRGVVTATGASVEELIGEAYEIDASLRRFTLKGGPRQILGSRFDVKAVPPSGAAAGQNRQMLRRLLADRFKLRVHTEKQRVPVYSIVVAKPGRLGPRLRRSKHDCTAFVAAGGTQTKADAPRDDQNRLLCWGNYEWDRDNPARMTIRHAGTMATLIERVQPMLDRPAVDATGLTGSYEWGLTYTRERRPNEEFATIGTAFEEQLGLRLEPREAAIDVVVIDALELPVPD